MMTDSSDIDKAWSQMKWVTSSLLRGLSWLRSVPPSYRLVFWSFVLVTIPWVGWTLMHFKFQSLVWVGSVMLRLWSVAPSFLKLLMVLSGALLFVLIVWTLILRRQQGFQIPRRKSNRILDDLESYLNEQVSSHALEMEATSQRIASYFPPTVGVQGPEIGAQIEVAKRTCQAIEQRWERDRRCIQDSYLHIGLREDTDKVIAKRVVSAKGRVQETVRRIRETVQSRYFRGADSRDFEQTWSTIHVGSVA